MDLSHSPIFLDCPTIFYTHDFEAERCEVLKILFSPCGSLLCVISRSQLLFFLTGQCRSKLATYHQKTISDNGFFTDVACWVAEGLFVTTTRRLIYKFTINTPHLPTTLNQILLHNDKSINHLGFGSHGPRRHKDASASSTSVTIAWSIPPPFGTPVAISADPTHVVVSLMPDAPCTQPPEASPLAFLFIDPNTGAAAQCLYSSTLGGVIARSPAWNQLLATYGLALSDLKVDPTALRPLGLHPLPTRTHCAMALVPLAAGPVILMTTQPHTITSEPSSCPLSPSFPSATSPPTAHSLPNSLPTPPTDFTVFTIIWPRINPAPSPQSTYTRPEHGASPCSCSCHSTRPLPPLPTHTPTAIAPDGSAIAVATSLLAIWGVAITDYTFSKPQCAQNHTSPNPSPNRCGSCCRGLRVPSGSPVRAHAVQQTLLVAWDQNWDAPDLVLPPSPWAGIEWTPPANPTAHSLSVSPTPHTAPHIPPPHPAGPIVALAFVPVRTSTAFPSAPPAALAVAWAGGLALRTRTSWTAVWPCWTFRPPMAPHQAGYCVPRDGLVASPDGRTLALPLAGSVPSSCHPEPTTGTGPTLGIHYPPLPLGPPTHCSQPSHHARTSHILPSHGRLRGTGWVELSLAQCVSSGGDAAAPSLFLADSAVLLPTSSPALIDAAYRPTAGPITRRSATEPDPPPLAVPIPPLEPDVPHHPPPVPLPIAATPATGGIPVDEAAVIEVEAVAARHTLPATPWTLTSLSPLAFPSSGQAPRAPPQPLLTSIYPPISYIRAAFPLRFAAVCPGEASGILPAIAVAGVYGIAILDQDQGRGPHWHCGGIPNPWASRSDTAPFSVVGPIAMFGRWVLAPIMSPPPQHPAHPDTASITMFLRHSPFLSTALGSCPLPRGTIIASTLCEASRDPPAPHTPIPPLLYVCLSIGQRAPRITIHVVRPANRPHTFDIAPITHLTLPFLPASLATLPPYSSLILSTDTHSLSPFPTLLLVHNQTRQVTALQLCPPDLHTHKHPQSHESDPPDWTSVLTAPSPARPTHTNAIPSPIRPHNLPSGIRALSPPFVLRPPPYGPPTPVFIVPSNDTPPDPSLPITNSAVMALVLLPLPTHEASPHGLFALHIADCDSHHALAGTLAPSSLASLSHRTSHTALSPDAASLWFVASVPVPGPGAGAARLEMFSCSARQTLVHCASSPPRRQHSIRMWSGLVVPQHLGTQTSQPPLTCTNTLTHLWPNPIPLIGPSFRARFSILPLPHLALYPILTRILQHTTTIPDGFPDSPHGLVIPHHTVPILLRQGAFQAAADRLIHLLLTPSSIPSLPRTQWPALSSPFGLALIARGFTTTPQGLLGFVSAARKADPAGTLTLITAPTYIPAKPSLSPHTIPFCSTCTSRLTATAQIIADPLQHAFPFHFTVLGARGLLVALTAPQWDDTELLPSALALRILSFLRAAVSGKGAPCTILGGPPTCLECLALPPDAILPRPTWDHTYWFNDPTAPTWIAAASAPRISLPAALQALASLLPLVQLPTVEAVSVAAARHAHLRRLVFMAVAEVCAAALLPSIPQSSAAECPDSSIRPQKLLRWLRDRVSSFRIRVGDAAIAISEATARADAHAATLLRKADPLTHTDTPACPPPQSTASVSLDIQYDLLVQRARHTAATLRLRARILRRVVAALRALAGLELNPSLKLANDTDPQPQDTPPDTLLLTVSLPCPAPSTSHTRNGSDSLCGQSTVFTIVLDTTQVTQLGRTNADTSTSLVSALYSALSFSGVPPRPPPDPTLIDVLAAGARVSSIARNAVPLAQALGRPALAVAISKFAERVRAAAQSLEDTDPATGSTLASRGLADPRTQSRSSHTPQAQDTDYAPPSPLPGSQCSSAAAAVALALLVPPDPVGLTAMATAHGVPIATLVRSSLSLPGPDRDTPLLPRALTEFVATALHSTGGGAILENQPWEAVGAMSVPLMIARIISQLNLPRPTIWTRLPKDPPLQLALAAGLGYRCLVHTSTVTRRECVVATDVTPDSTDVAEGSRSQGHSARAVRTMLESGDVLCQTHLALLAAPASLAVLDAVLGGVMDAMQALTDATTVVSGPAATQPHIPGVRRVDSFSPDQPPLPKHTQHHDTCLVDVAACIVSALGVVIGDIGAVVWACSVSTVAAEGVSQVAAVPELAGLRPFVLRVMALRDRVGDPRGAPQSHIPGAEGWDPRCAPTHSTDWRTSSGLVVLMGRPASISTQP